MDINATWADGLEDEVRSWRAWLTEDRFAEARAPRLERRRQFQFQGDVRPPVTGRYRILDVGSGPISSLGNMLGTHEAELVPLDPLADEYNALLGETGYSGYPSVVKGVGEELSREFAKNKFDYVFAGNSLDHAYDPIRVAVEMTKVCKPGGRVHIVVKDNEGERQSYQGLHQWNFRLDGDAVIVWRPGEEHVLNDMISRGSIVGLKSKPYSTAFQQFEILTILIEATDELV